MCIYKYSNLLHRYKWEQVYQLESQKGLGSKLVGICPHHLEYVPVMGICPCSFRGIIVLIKKKYKKLNTRGMLEGLNSLLLHDKHRCKPPHHRNFLILKHR